MAAVVKRKRRNQKSNQKKSRAKQTKQRKRQAKQRKARSKQATKHVKKPMKKKGSHKDKECQLTKKAKGVLGSYVEGLCKCVSSEAERLRKESCEPQISGEVLQTALEQSMSKENTRCSVTPGVKKTKKRKESSTEVNQMASSPSEKQAAPNQKLPKQRKTSTTPTSN